MNITFYDGNGKLFYNPNTEIDFGVGGTETVIIQTAKTLAQNGHKISVYINCDKPNIYDNVSYYQYQTYKPQNEDVLVGFENFPDKYNAKKVVNWVNRFYVENVSKYPFVDKIFVMSEWHLNHFKSILPINLVEKMSIINPGIISDFWESKIEKEFYNITYSGHPGKGGMNVLVPIMNELKLKIPSIQINVYGGGKLWGWDDAIYHSIYDNLNNNYITYYGQVGKNAMVNILNKAQIFLYPVGSHHKETFCLQVLEAMASGCVVIASNSGNVKNLVGNNGYIIHGDINNILWIKEVIKTIVKLYSNPTLMNNISEKAKSFAKQFTWQNTVKTFEKEILQ